MRESKSSSTASLHPHKCITLKNLLDLDVSHSTNCQTSLWSSTDLPPLAPPSSGGGASSSSGGTLDNLPSSPSSLSLAWRASFFASSAAAKVACLFSLAARAAISLALLLESRVLSSEGGGARQKTGSRWLPVLGDHVHVATSSLR